MFSGSRESSVSRSAARGLSVANGSAWIQSGKGLRAPPPSIRGYGGVDGPAFRNGQLGSGAGGNCERRTAAWGKRKAFGRRPRRTASRCRSRVPDRGALRIHLQRSLQEQTILERYPWWCDLRAVRKGNVAFADGNLLFNRSGMTSFSKRRGDCRNHPRHFVRRTGRREVLARIERPAKEDSRCVSMSRA